MVAFHSMMPFFVTLNDSAKSFSTVHKQFADYDTTLILCLRTSVNFPFVPVYTLHPIMRPSG